MCHLDNVTAGHKLLWHLCNPAIQPSTRLFSLNKQVSPLLNTRTLIIHMELNRTLFIKATAPGNFVLLAIHLCVCSTRKQESWWEKKDIELAHAEAAKFLIGN